MSEVRAKQAVYREEDELDVRDRLLESLDSLDEAAPALPQVDTTGVPTDGVPDEVVADLVAYYERMGLREVSM